MEKRKPEVRQWLALKIHSPRVTATDGSRHDNEAEMSKGQGIRRCIPPGETELYNIPRRIARRHVFITWSHPMGKIECTNIIETSVQGLRDALLVAT